MAETLYASFSDAALAEKAVGALLDHGARNEDITLVASRAHARAGESAVGASGPGVTDEWDDEEALADDELVHTRSAASAAHARRWHDGERNPEQAAKEGISTTTPGDAAAGAAAGAGIGLAVGTAAALASLFIPGIGLVTGAGALATALAGAAGATAAGGIAGGVTGYLRDMGVPDEAARDYHRSIESGGAMLAVHVPSNNLDRASAESILAKYGGANFGTYAALSR